MELLNQNPEQNPPEEHNKGFLQSTTAKIIMVGALTLVLLIPLLYVRNLIKERSNYQKQVTNEISSQWGSNVYFYGPVLKVPFRGYNETQTVDKTTGTSSYQRTYYTDYAYFFPEDLKITADVQTESKHRNNYETAVFTSKMNFKGNYSTPDFTSKNIPAENIEWEKATILIQTQNIKSIKGAMNIGLNGGSYAFEPVAKENEANGMSALETAPINLRDAFGNGSVPFEFNIAYNGSRQLSIVPIGKQTEASMSSNWRTPAFSGNFLPEKNNVTDNGFTASWKISHFNRPFAQQHFSVLPNLSEYSFDVNFLIPVDEYQQNERASKYGFLVIGLTFLIFFLIQSISKISIHIFQYTMIGLALVMFYTLLISITEHSSFRIAYLIAGVAVVAMITLYSFSILKNRKFPLLIASALSALYIFIYVIIQLENYALLAGSIGLFVILGAVMYFSRRIDWNK